MDTSRFVPVVGRDSTFVSLHLDLPDINLMLSSSGPRGQHVFQ